MATPFRQIYQRFLNQINDADLLEATEDTIKELLFDFLKGSIVEFEYRCDKSLNYINPASNSIKLPVKNNKTKFNDLISENLELNIFCPLTGRIFFKDTDYVINLIKNVEEEYLEIQFITNLVMDEVIVEYDFEGEFEQELDNTEQHILVIGMLLHWISPKINLEENLSNVVTDKDYRQLSPANMLHRLTSYKKTIREDLENYIQRYNFKDFGGF